MSKMQTYKLLDFDARIAIPPEVAVCPYCETKLTASFHGWSEDRNGWKAIEVSLDCESEPDFDSEEYDEWLNWHSDMPYVHLLPVETEVLAWVNGKYRFNP